MTDAIFQGWTALPDRSVKVTYWGKEADLPSSNEEADCIPDWAALAVALGIVLAISGFVSACLTDRGWATLLLTAGLIVAAIGMRGAEKAVNSESEWRVLPNG